MGRVLVLSGKKQSGKNSALNCIYGWFLVSLGVIERFSIDEETGALKVPQGEDHHILVDPTEPEFQKWADETVVPNLERPISSFIKSYSFADALKQKVCIDILGLSWEQCYGTDEDKNSYTNIMWENMPLRECDVDFFEGRIYRDKTGRMTAREVMQHIGTDVFRAIYGNVWVDAVYRQIEKDQPDLAIIYDGRFPNEIPKDSHDKKSLRFGRCMFDDDHDSETALDNCQHIFSVVVDNQDITIHEKNEEMRKVLEDWDWFPKYLLGEFICEESE